MTMISRVLGLLRDIVFARFIGADAGADAFFVAFKVPNFLRRLFAEGAFAQAFVPVLSEYRQKGSVEATRAFIDRIAGCLGLSVILVCSLVVVAAPAFTAVFGMGFLVNSPEKFALTTDLIRITFPYLALISLAGFAGAILNSYDRFAIPALTPVLLNVVLIVAAAFVAPHMDVPVMALAWGVLLAGALQLGFQLPFLKRLGLLPHPKVDWLDPSVRKVLSLMAPAMFGVSVSQINLMFDTILASFLPTGSVSWLYYSDRLTELPLGVFGVGIATVILPALSRQYSAQSGEQHQTLDWALRMVLLVAVPSALALVVLAKPILMTLFQYGETSEFAMVMASYSLQAYALGLAAFMLIKVLVTGYFSRQDTRTPVRIGVIAMLANMVMNVAFVLPFHFLWQIGHAGLALATTGSAFLNAALLLQGLRQKGAYQPQPGWKKFSVQLLMASSAMIVVVWLLLQQMPGFADLVWWQRVANVAALCIAGVVAYVVVLLGLGMRPRDIRPAS
jgi:putative peptidoglycan lipid II flippase